jgi:hypothetical protein
MLMLKKLMDLNFEPSCSIGSMAMIRPKSQSTRISQGGDLFIRNLVLKKPQIIISLFQCKKFQYFNDNSLFFVWSLLLFDSFLLKLQRKNIRKYIIF